MRKNPIQKTENMKKNLVMYWKNNANSNHFFLKQIIGLIKKTEKISLIWKERKFIEIKKNTIFIEYKSNINITIGEYKI